MRYDDPFKEEIDLRCYEEEECKSWIDRRGLHIPHKSIFAFQCPQKIFIPIPCATSSRER